MYLAAPCDAQCVLRVGCTWGAICCTSTSTSCTRSTPAGAVGALLHSNRVALSCVLMPFATSHPSIDRLVRLTLEKLRPSLATDSSGGQRSLRFPVKLEPDVNADQGCQLSGEASAYRGDCGTSGEGGGGGRLTLRKYIVDRMFTGLLRLAPSAEECRRRGVTGGSASASDGGVGSDAESEEDSARSAWGCRGGAGDSGSSAAKRQRVEDVGGNLLASRDLSSTSLRRKLMGHLKHSGGSARSYSANISTQLTSKVRTSSN